MLQHPFCSVVAIDTNSCYLTKTYSTICVFHREGELDLTVFYQHGLLLIIKNVTNTPLLLQALAPVFGGNTHI